MDSDIGGILENLWGGDAQKNSLFCVRFRTLRYSKLAKICKGHEKNATNSPHSGSDSVSFFS